MDRVKQLRNYLESHMTGLRINGAYANGVGNGSLIYIGNEREAGENEWQFIPNFGTPFIANEMCINKNLETLYNEIVKKYDIKF